MTAPTTGNSDTAPWEDGPDVHEGEIVRESAMSVHEGGERARADVAVVTAQRYKRTIKAFLNDLETFACASPAMAEECFYVLERKNRDGSKKLIIGPSVRFAELLLVAYRNLVVSVRLESDDGKVITVVGACRDVERNIGQEVPVSRRVTDRNGRRYSEDMVAVTMQAAGAIAKRNAIVGVVPKAMWMPVWEKAKALARGDLKSINERTGVAFDLLAKMGVPAARVLVYIGKPSQKDVDADDLLALHTLCKQIKEGETDPSTVGVEETAPAADVAASATAAVVQGRAKGKSSRAPAAPETKPEPAKTEPAKQEPAKEAKTSAPTAPATEAIPDGAV